MRFGIWSAFTVGFNDEIKHNTGFKISFLLSSYFIWNAGMLHYVSHHKFFKRKKRKKESRLFKWKVSEKQVFLKKYYPIRDRCNQRLNEIRNCFETVRVEIFLKTRRAWTCFSEYLQLIFASFFLFFVLFPYWNCLSKIGSLFDEDFFLGLFFVVDTFFGQGYRFLFAYWGCCDWFHEKLMPRYFNRMHYYQLNK